MSAIRSDSPLVPELSALEAEIEAEVRVKAENPFEEATRTLRENYVNAMTREMEVLNNSGKRDTASALRGEIQSMASGLMVPPGNDSEVPIELQRLRTAFRKEHAKFEEMRRDRMRPLVESFNRKAEDLEFTLTRDGRVEEARAIGAERSLFWIRRSNLATVSSKGEIAKFSNGTPAFSNRAC